MSSVSSTHLSTRSLVNVDTRLPFTFIELDRVFTAFAAFSLSISCREFPRLLRHVILNFFHSVCKHVSCRMCSIEKFGKHLFLDVCTQIAASDGTPLSHAYSLLSITKRQSSFSRHPVHLLFFYISCFWRTESRLPWRGETLMGMRSAFPKKG